MFIILAILITLISIYFLASPLRKTRQTVSFEREQQNIHFAQERIRELDDQLKEAKITPTEYEALKLEIEQTLAQDVDLDQKALDNSGSHREVSGTTVGNKERSYKSVIGMALFVVACTSIIYALVGNFPASQWHNEMRQQFTQENVEEMITQVERRVAQVPDDAEGWLILARVYSSLGRFEESENAYLKLIELKGESADLLAALADVQAFKQQGRLNAEQYLNIEKALVLDPLHPQALWLDGLYHVQNGNAERAKQAWVKLLPLLEDNPEQQAQLRELIAETNSDSIKEVENLNQASQEQQVQSPTQSSGPVIKLKVNIDTSIQAPSIKGKGDTTVFVLARATNGPPAPLAVKRLTLADLPADIELSDADAMMAQLSLSKFEEVTVVARLSLSGNPIAQSGDFQSEALSLNLSENSSPSVELQINQQVP